MTSCMSCVGRAAGLIRPGCLLLVSFPDGRVVDTHFSNPFGLSAPILGSPVFVSTNIVYEDTGEAYPLYYSCPVRDTTLASISRFYSPGYIPSSAGFEYSGDEFFTTAEIAERFISPLDLTGLNVLCPCDDCHSEIYKAVRARTRFCDFSSSRDMWDPEIYSGYSCVITNPPFTNLKQYITLLSRKHLYFALIVPTSLVHQLCNDDRVSIYSAGWCRYIHADGHAAIVPSSFVYSSNWGCMLDGNALASLGSGPVS